MTIHCLGCLIKNTPANQLYTAQIPTRDSSVGKLLFPNTYAYFIFDLEVDPDSLSPISAPSNYSNFTFLGGTVYDIKTLISTHGHKPEFVNFLINTQATHVILTSNNNFFPFNNGDILLNINL